MRSNVLPHSTSGLSLVYEEKKAMREGRPGETTDTYLIDGNFIHRICEV